MPNTVTGSYNVAVSLTTKFGSGTAGVATESNNFGGQPVQIGSSYAAGMQLADVWSNIYAGLTGTTTIDLSALVGIGGRAISLAALKFALAINCDPTSGHDVQIGPGATNGLAAPFAATSDYWTALGGMPGAGLVSYTSGVQPVGNQVLFTNFPSGWAIDPAHKTLTLTVPAGTVANFVLVLAG